MQYRPAFPLLPSYTYTYSHFSLCLSLLFFSPPQAFFLSVSRATVLEEGGLKLVLALDASRLVVPALTPTMLISYGGMRKYFTRPALDAKGETKGERTGVMRMAECMSVWVYEYYF